MKFASGAKGRLLPKAWKVKNAEWAGRSGTDSRYDFAHVSIGWGFGIRRENGLSFTSFPNPQRGNPPKRDLLENTSPSSAKRRFEGLLIRRVVNAAIRIERAALIGTTEDRLQLRDRRTQA